MKRLLSFWFSSLAALALTSRQKGEMRFTLCLSGIVLGMIGDDPGAFTNGLLSRLFPKLVQFRSADHSEEML